MSSEPSAAHATSTYALGHAEVELQRLQLPDTVRGLAK